MGFHSITGISYYVVCIVIIAQYLTLAFAKFFIARPEIILVQTEHVIYIYIYILFRIPWVTILFLYLLL